VTQGSDPAEGRHVYDAVDVDRPYFRHHLSLFGLSHGIVTQGQYSALVAAVIASAVVPTLIANIWFLHTICCESGRTGCRTGRVWPVFCVAAREAERCIQRFLWATTVRSRKESV